MDDIEKIRFNDFMRKFSKEQLVGWLSAIAFIMPRNTNINLGNELNTMYNICSEILVNSNKDAK